jgi:hypothetical protein
MAKNINKNNRIYNNVIEPIDEIMLFLISDSIDSYDGKEDNLITEAREKLSEAKSLSADYINHNY